MQSTYALLPHRHIYTADSTDPCGWRCPPSPWRTWNGRYRAWNRAPGPPGLGSGLWSWPGTSLACRDNAPEPPPSGRAAQLTHCCCWPWSRVSPQSAHSHRRAEGDRITANTWSPRDTCASYNVQCSTIMWNMLILQYSHNCRKCAVGISFVVITVHAFSPCRYPVCSERCGMPERWCLVGCCLHLDCPGPLHP